MILVILMPVLFTLEGCKKDNNNSPVINIFSLQDDIDLGMQLDAQIKSDPADYPTFKFTAISCSISIS